MLLNLLGITFFFIFSRIILYLCYLYSSKRKKKFDKLYSVSRVGTRFEINQVNS